MPLSNTNIIDTFKKNEKLINFKNITYVYAHNLGSFDGIIWLKKFKLNPLGREAKPTIKKKRYEII